MSRRLNFVCFALSTGIKDNLLREELAETRVSLDRSEQLRREQRRYVKVPARSFSSSFLLVFVVVRL